MDRGVVTRGAGQPAVSRDQRRAKFFAQRDECAVVGGHVLPQLPDPFRQRVVGVADEREIVEVAAQRVGIRSRERLAADELVQRAKYLDVNEMRRVEIAIASEDVVRRMSPVR